MKILAILKKPWPIFSRATTKLPEKVTWETLEAELTGGKRTSYLMRLFEHANKLRAQRQRKALLERSVLEEDRP